MLPPELRNRAERRARQLGISFGELVRRTLAAALEGNGAGEIRDPLFSDDAVFRGDAPSDASSRHDDYLYGRET